jgi:hypothetical protein
MRGRRPGKTGGVFAGIHGGFFRAEHDADGRRSFAAVERSMSDRLLSTTDLMSSLVQSCTAHSHHGLYPSPVSGSQDDSYDCPLGDVPWTVVRCAVIHFHH